MVKVLIVSHCLARDKLTGRKFMKRRKEKTLKSFRKALTIIRGLIGDDCACLYSQF